MWKHGGGMDRIDGFRISEADIAKVVLFQPLKLNLLVYIMPYTTKIDNRQIYKQNLTDTYDFSLHVFAV